jgi:hypothetical protein
MGENNFFDKLKKEAKLLIGEAAKNKNFYSQKEYPDIIDAAAAFEVTKKKLLDINKWSELPGFTSEFQIFDKARKPKEKPDEGDFIRIILPGPLPENWVRIIAIKDEGDLVFLSVRPDKNPCERDKEEIDHFFSPESTNNFAIELDENKVNAYVLGRKESINNRGEKAGDRAIINTIIAEGGWAFFQDIQWQTLTDYLVNHLEV